VIDVGLPVYAGNDTLIRLGDSIFIGRPPEVGLNEDCIWFVHGVPIDTIAGMWVKPDSNTTYVLEQNICGNISYDTVTVFVSPNGINEFGSEDQIKIYPNPSSDNLTIEAPPQSTIEISSIQGQLIKTLAASGTKTNINVSELPSGVYVVEVRTEKGVAVKKFIKE